MVACADTLRRSGRGAAGAAGFAGAARSVLATLHEQFVDEAGEPACPLLRIYRVRPYRRLPAGQRGRLAGAPPEPTSPCATLLAAHGESWRRFGPVLPLADPAAAATAPLVAALAATLERDSGRPD